MRILLRDIESCREKRVQEFDSDKSGKFAVIEDVRETEIQMSRHW